MIIPFVDWQPDAVDFGAQGSAIITNAVPAERSFQPFPSFAQFSNAIDSRPRGGIEAFDRDDVSHLYVGNETKLFELDSSSSIVITTSAVVLLAPSVSISMVCASVKLFAPVGRQKSKSPAALPD